MDPLLHVGQHGGVHLSCAEMPTRSPSHPVPVGRLSSPPRGLSSHTVSIPLVSAQAAVHGSWPPRERKQEPRGRLRRGLELAESFQPYSLCPRKSQGQSGLKGAGEGRVLFLEGASYVFRWEKFLATTFEEGAPSYLTGFQSQESQEDVAPGQTGAGQTGSPWVMNIQLIFHNVHRLP